jgi:hypothetical protein
MNPYYYKILLFVSEYTLLLKYNIANMVFLKLSLKRDPFAYNTTYTSNKNPHVKNKNSRDDIKKALHDA